MRDCQNMHTNYGKNTAVTYVLLLFEEYKQWQRDCSIGPPSPVDADAETQVLTMARNGILTHVAGLCSGLLAGNPTLPTGHTAHGIVQYRGFQETHYRHTSPASLRC